MTAPTRQCPKCGRVVPEAEECAGCGVLFSKIRAAETASPASPSSLNSQNSQGFQSSQSFQTQGRGSGPRSQVLTSLVGLVVVLAVGAWAAVGWIGGGTDEPVEPEEVAGSAAPPQPWNLAREAAAPDSDSIRSARERLAALPPLERPDEPTRAPQPAQVSQPAQQAQVSQQARPAPPTHPPTHPQARWVAPDSSWFEGATGFERGLTRARDKNQAVLVYFYADWCGYCRQLESEILSRAVVEEYTKYLVKIKINPEDGATERMVSDSYGVTGYPAVFVHAAGFGSAKKIRGMTKKSGNWRPLSTRDYVANLVAATGERFGPS